jgi:hypothetical protein
MRMIGSDYFLNVQKHNKVVCKHKDFFFKANGVARFDDLKLFFSYLVHFVGFNFVM